jgi:8-oxo-dGTP pyrophosphatase MutT (NUDIX family)
MSTLFMSKKYIGAGIVLVRTTSEGPCFLLLRGTDTGVWSFPKGHTELRDRGDPLATAIRETWEETGYRAEADYTIISERFRLGKRPYWVGRMNAMAEWAPCLAPREHSMFGWFRAGDLESLNANTDVRALVKHQKRHMQPWSLLGGAQSTVAAGLWRHFLCPIRGHHL